MPASRMANPPLLQTDLATNESYYTKQRVPSDWVHLPKPPPASTIRRYTEGPGSPGMIGLANTPGSFADKAYRNGVIGLLGTRRVDGVTSVRLATHKLGGTATGYASGWHVAHDPIFTDDWDRSGYFTPVPTGMMAAQRLGDTAYALMNVKPFDENEKLIVVRIHGVNDFSVVEYEQNSYSDLPVFMNRDSQMFVSDDQHPFVWIIEGNGYVTGFWDKPSAFPADTSTFHPFLGYHQFSGATTLQEGQLGAYRQLIQFEGPGLLISSNLVHPWSAGDYGPPELWHVVQTVHNELNIYRSRWSQGAWRMPPDHTFFDGQLSSTRFPTRNPKGYAFEQHWFDAAHKVATITRRDGSIFSMSGIGRMVFMRDLKVQGRMHFVALPMLDFGPPLWTGRSDDDGQKWVNVVNVPDASSVRTQHGSAVRSGFVSLDFTRFRAVRVMENNTLVGANETCHYYRAGDVGDFVPYLESPMDCGARAAFIVTDRVGTSVSTPDGSVVVFKRGENRGAPAWL